MEFPYGQRRLKFFDIEWRENINSPECWNAFQSIYVKNNPEAFDSITREEFEQVTGRIRGFLIDVDMFYGYGAVIQFSAFRVVCRSRDSDIDLNVNTINGVRWEVRLRKGKLDGRKFDELSAFYVPHAELLTTSERKEIKRSRMQPEDCSCILCSDTKLDQIKGYAFVCIVQIINIWFFLGLVCRSVVRTVKINLRW